MTENHMQDETLCAITDEIAALEKQRLGMFAEVGEMALPALRDKPEFTELAAKIDKIAEKLGGLRQRESELLEEKARREKEEKERQLALTCFACKRVNPEGARFCEQCGGKLGEPPREYCKACSTLNSPNMKFCGECGAKLDATEA